MSDSVLGSIRVQGEFRLSSALARRVQRAVEEIVQQFTIPDLSHVDDDCALCRSPQSSVLGPQSVPSQLRSDGGRRTEDGGLPEEASRAASEPDRAGRQWIA